MIREAAVGELAAVVRISKFASPWIVGVTPNWLVKELAKPGITLYVEAEAPGHVRGYMLLSQQAQMGRIVELVAVDEDHRGQGVGAALVSSVSGPAWTWIHPDNDVSISMFTSLGWVRASPPSKRADKLYFSLPGD